MPDVDLSQHQRGHDAAERQGGQGEVEPTQAQGREGHEPADERGRRHPRGDPDPGHPGLDTDALDARVVGHHDPDRAERQRDQVDLTGVARERHQ